MTANKEFIRSMRRKYQSFLQPSGNISDIMSGKDMDQIDPSMISTSRGPGATFTGRGMDNEVQADKPAGVVHEGEVVVPNGAVRNIGGPEAVKNILNKAQTQGPKGGKVFDPSKDVTKNLGILGRGPQAELPPHPESNRSDKPMELGVQNRRLPGFQEGGEVETLVRAEPQTLKIQSAAPAQETITRAEPETMSFNQPSDELAPAPSVTKTAFTPDQTDTLEQAPPATMTIKREATPEERLETFDPIKNIQATTDRGVDRLDEFLDGIDIQDIEAPELDEALLQRSERGQNLTAKQDALIRELDGITKGNDPIFNKLADAQRARMAGQLNAARGKQSQVASQMGLTGGALNAFYATVRRDQEIKSLGLEESLANQQMGRIDAAYGTMNALLNNAISQEDAWTQIKNNLIVAYDQMNMSADQANQVKELNEATLRSNVVQAMARVEQWGAENSQVAFENWRSELFGHGKVLLGLDTPEGYEAFKNMAQRYFPELAQTPEVWDDLIERGYAADYIDGIELMNLEMTDMEYTGIMNTVDNETQTLTDPNAPYMKGLLDSWNARNGLNNNDPGYLTSFNDLKNNPEAMKWAYDTVIAQGAKQSSTYAATKNKTESWALGMFDNIGFVNENGEVTKAFNDVADLDKFLFGGLNGVEAVKLWYGTAIENEAITVGEDGEILTDWDSELLKVYSNQVAGFEELTEIKSRQLERYTESKGWPEGLDRSKPMTVTYPDGKTETLNFGQEIPIGEGLTYSHDGKDVSLDKEFLNFKEENPNLNLSNSTGSNTTGSNTGTQGTGDDSNTKQDQTTSTTTTINDVGYNVDSEKVILGLTYEQAKENLKLTDEQLLNHPEYKGYFSKASKTESLGGVQYNIDTAKKVDGKTFDEVLNETGKTVEELKQDAKYQDFFTMETDPANLEKPNAITSSSNFIQTAQYYSAKNELNFENRRELSGELMKNPEWISEIAKNTSLWQDLINMGVATDTTPNLYGYDKYDSQSALRKYKEDNPTYQLYRKVDADGSQSIYAIVPKQGSVGSNNYLEYDLINLQTGARETKRRDNVTYGKETYPSLNTTPRTVDYTPDTGGAGSLLA